MNREHTNATRLFWKICPASSRDVASDLNLGDPLIVDALGRLALSIAQPNPNGSLTHQRIVVP